MPQGGKLLLTQLLHPVHTPWAETLLLLPRQGCLHRKEQQKVVCQGGRTRGSEEADQYCCVKPSPMLYKWETSAPTASSCSDPRQASNSR